MAVRDTAKFEIFHPSIDALGPFEAKPRIALAISGGADSMALMLILADWARKRGGRLVLIHVDHGLRAGSDKEAAWIESQISPNWDHVKFISLTWQGEKPVHRLQERARQVRYDLMAQYCRDHGILHLFLAHHFQDQQETIAMRAEHGSTPYGKAGMSALRLHKGVRLLRPLLCVPKERLITLLTSEGHSWIEDPSNRWLRFERTKWRQKEIAISDNDVIQNGRLRIKVENEVTDYLVRNIILETEGYFSILNFSISDISIVSQALPSVARCLSHKSYPPSFMAVKEMLTHICQDERVMSLGHCLWQRKGDRLVIAKEAAHSPYVRVLNEELEWDHRFRCWVRDTSLKDLWIGPLGEKGLNQLAGKVDVRSIPVIARASLPALWQDQRLLCVPDLNWGEGLRIEIIYPQPLTSSLFELALGAVSTI